MSAVKLVAVFAENKLGQVAAITRVLADAQVNIRSVTFATADRFGVIRFVVNKSDLACQCLKEKGFAVSLVEVLAVKVEDKPGGLHRVADVLSRHQINVQNSSGFVTTSNQSAVLILEVKDVVQAREVLQAEGFHLLTQEELLTV